MYEPLPWICLKAYTFAWSKPLKRPNNLLTIYSSESCKLEIVGLSAVGRVAIVELKMNDEIIVSSRRRWVSVGWHPPK